MPAREYVAPSAVASYTAQDAAGRHETVAQVTTLSWRSGSWPRAANGTILMMDDRRPSNDSAAARQRAGWPLEEGEPWVRSARYHHKTFALNQLYANRHGLEFVLVRPTVGAWLKAGGDPTTGLCPAWCRVKILAHFVLRLLGRAGATEAPARGMLGGMLGGGSERPHWILYIDSDAYIREHSVDVLHRLSDPLNAHVHFAIAREELPAGAFRSPKRRTLSNLNSTPALSPLHASRPALGLDVKSARVLFITCLRPALLSPAACRIPCGAGPHGVRTPSMNAGVLMMRASEWTAQLLAAWMRAPDTPVCAPFRMSWPCEQQCFHELLRNRSLLPHRWRERIATAPMQLFNSPWGSFIRHVWGGPGVEVRARARHTDCCARASTPPPRVSRRDGRTREGPSGIFLAATKICSHEMALTGLQGGLKSPHRARLCSGAVSIWIRFCSFPPPRPPQLRKRAFDDELRVQGVWRRKQFERLVEQAHATWIDMPC